MRTFRFVLVIIVFVLSGINVRAVVAEPGPGLSFPWNDFDRVLELARENHLDPSNINLTRGYATAATDVLRSLDPPVMILPQSIFDRLSAGPDGKKPGRMIETKAVHSCVLFEPGAGPEKQTYLLFSDTLPGEWTKIGFDRKAFEDVIQWVEQSGRRPALSGNESAETSAESIIFRAAANGFLTAYDPHSAVINMSAFDRNRVQPESASGFGIGLLLRKRTSGETVVETPLPDSPALQAGLHFDDIIRKVDGKPIKDIPLKEIVRMMQGPAGSKVILEVERPASRRLLTFSVERRKFLIPFVSSELRSGGIGIIRIGSFLFESVPTTDAVRAAYYELLNRAGGRLTGLILDLRGNTGGALDEGMNVAGLFLSAQSPVLRIQTKEKTTEAKSRFPRMIPDGLPVMVLVNAVSYGSSEIVAAALMDNNAAIIVGERTYGGGSVQSLRSLGRYVLKLTTARYESPLGNQIHVYGITPDIAISEEEDNSFPERHREVDLWKHLPAFPARPVDQTRTAWALRIKQAANLSDVDQRLRARRGEAIRPDYMLERALAYFPAFAKSPRP